VLPTPTQPLTHQPQALGGHLSTCRWLFDVGCKEEIHTQNAHGNNPLHFACRQGQMEVAEWLVSVMDVDVKVAVTVQNKQNNTPMHFACRGGHLNMVK